MQFLKSMILIFLDKSKYRAHSEFNKMQKKITIHMKDPILAINFNLKKFLKGSKPFVLFVSNKSLLKPLLAKIITESYV